MFNLLVVFVLCGLWHGANWTYLAWGLLHGGVLILERYRLGRIIEKTWLPLRFVYTQMVLMLSWVFFRSESLTQIGGYLTAMFRFGPAEIQFVDLWSTKLAWLMPVGILCCLPVRQWATGLRPIPNGWWPSLARGLVAVATVLVFWASISQVVAGKHVPFIYFRF